MFFLYGDLICSYTLSEYISDIYVDGLCIISVKKLIMKSRDFVRRYCTMSHWLDRLCTQWLG